MRIAVVGASGNAGTSLLEALEDDPDVTSVVGICRQPPEGPTPWAKVEWRPADIRRTALAPLFDGAEAVVHLAWAIQPSHDEVFLRQVNVDGSVRVFEAAAAARVPTLVYASSVGAYSPGPKELVDETWPTHGLETSFYARHKAYLERVLDSFELRHPEMRVVRLRPALIFKRPAGSEVRRLFLGGLMPRRLLHPRVLPVVPDIPQLRFQCVHSLDIGEAYRLAVKRDVRGAFNIAAAPVLDPDVLAEALGVRKVPVPRPLARTAAALSWRFHLQPTPEGWLDMGLETPLLDTTRARSELGWSPRHTATEALRELLYGVAEGAKGETPHLAASIGAGRESAE